MTQHGGEKVKVKHLGAPDNPFVLASSKKKCTQDLTLMHNMEVVHIYLQSSYAQFITFYGLIKFQENNIKNNNGSDIISSEVIDIPEIKILEEDKQMVYNIYNYDINIKYI